MTIEFKCERFTTDSMSDRWCITKTKIYVNNNNAEYEQNHKKNELAFYSHDH